MPDSKRSPSESIPRSRHPRTGAANTHVRDTSKHSSTALSKIPPTARTHASGTPPTTHQTPTRSIPETIEVEAVTVPPLQPESPTEVELRTYGEVDFMKLYPLTFRYTIRKSIGWFSVFAICFAVYHLLSDLGKIPHLFLFDERLILYMGIGLFLSRIIYWELYRRTLSTKLIGFRFITSRGVILTTIGSQPFVPFNEIYTSYDIFDIICGTKTVHYMTSFDPSQRTLRFEGLRPWQADSLLEFFSVFLTKQIGFPNAEVKTKVNLPSLAEEYSTGVR